MPNGDQQWAKRAKIAAERIESFIATKGEE
jgi:hypothetical protein